MLLGDDIAASAKALADMRIRSLALRRNAGRSVLDHTFSQATARGVNLAIAHREWARPSDAPKRKKCDFFEVDIPAELERSFLPPNTGAILSPRQDMANSCPEGSPDARSDSPPLRPLRARATSIIGIARR